MTQEEPKHPYGDAVRTSRPLFTIGVPAKSPNLDRLKVTLNSITSQNAVLAGRCRLRIRIIGSGWDRSCTSWLDEQISDEIHFEADQSSGLYQAVSQALEQQSGDAFGYLGVGDTYEPQAFDLILENTNDCTNSRPWWVTGMIVGRRSDGAIVRALTPYRYRRGFFQTGIHGTLLPTIQQESTFWSQTLNREVNWPTVRALSLAGDYELWRQFSAFCEPLVIEAVVGSFRWHGDNRSADWSTYWSEVERGSRRYRPAERIRAHADRVIWGLPTRVKAKMSAGQVRRYIWPEGPWTS